MIIFLYPFRKVFSVLPQRLSKSVGYQLRKQMGWRVQLRAPLFEVRDNTLWKTPHFHEVISVYNIIMNNVYTCMLYKKIYS